MNARRAPTVACIACLLAFTPAAAAPDAVPAMIAVDAQRHGDAIDVRASALLHADAATAWRVLTDYDHYGEFIPDLRVSRVLARHGNAVTVEQTGDAKLWLLRIPLEITFEIEETPLLRIRSRAVAGSMRQLTSDYALVPTGDGIRLEYTGQIAPGFELFGYLEQIAVRDNVARQFQALANEIERAYTAVAPRAPLTR